MGEKIFYCKSKRLADYLVKHGSKLIRKEKQNGIAVYVFESDESIDENIDKWEIDTSRCLF